jgi:hypothetical protein
VSRAQTLLLFTLLVALPLYAAGLKPNVATLRAADAEQMRIIVQGDYRAQQAFMHPNYIINGPSNEMLSKSVVVKMLSEGKMASDRFERTIERTAITGNVGIVMGREVVHPLPNSQLAGLHGDKVLNRRFTNIFLFEKGKWLFLARQATIVP